MYFATNNAFSILDWERQFGAPELRQRADAAAEVRDVADCLVGGELPASAFRPKSSTRQLQTSRS